MRKQVALLMAACALTACATSGPIYSQYLKTQTAIAPGSARITIYRTGENLEYSGKEARVSFDDKKVGKVTFNGFAAFDIASGSHVLKVDTWDTAGSCELKVDVQPNADYYYEVTPRQEHLAKSLVLGSIGTAIVAAGKECAGPFSIVAKPKEIANIALRPLNLSQ